MLRKVKLQTLFECLHSCEFPLLHRMNELFLLQKAFNTEGWSHRVVFQFAIVCCWHSASLAQNAEVSGRGYQARD